MLYVVEKTMNKRYYFIAYVLLAGCTSSSLHEPLPNAGLRATPLHFGLYVTPDPDQNPIDPPERFSGYHAATDFEVSQGELEGDVPVYALCGGKVIFSGFVRGYGGVVVHRCVIEKQHVTVLYGHLALEGLPPEGRRVRAGDTLGLLADANSHESGETRKHLHLGIHKGKRLVLAGYVQTEEQLKQYIDPQSVLSLLNIDLPVDQQGEVPYWKK